MGTSANMWLIDSRGNKIIGDSKIASRHESIDIMSIEHGIHSPYDPHTGRNTSPRKHSPFSILKSIDTTTPFFNKACCNGEKIQKVDVLLYRISETGREEVYFKYEVNDVKVVSVIPYIHCSMGTPDSEQVSFIYGKIRWTHLEGNFAHEDSWNER